MRKVNLWKLLPALMSGARAGLEGVEVATSDDSDGGRQITPDEAQDIAQRIGQAVAAEVFSAISGGDA